LQEAHPIARPEVELKFWHAAANRLDLPKIAVPRAVNPATDTHCGDFVGQMVNPIIELFRNI
jgi:hypothetical protein